mgnify:CR=1 FL=1
MKPLNNYIPDADNSRNHSSGGNESGLADKQIKTGGGHVRNHTIFNPSLEAMEYNFKEIDQTNSP